MGGGADTAMLNYHTARTAGNSRDPTCTTEHSHRLLSPLRRAMSLSTIFRSGGTGDVVSANNVPVQATSTTTTTTTTTVTPPTVRKPLGRMRRRLSLRSSPTASPATSSAFTSPTISTPSPSQPGSTLSSSIRGRPRSGSCRASLLSGSGGGGRILPFTLPTLGQTEDEDELSYGSKHNRFGADMTRITFVSPSVAPRRPITPAPLLILDEDQNNFTRITGDSAAITSAASNVRAAQGLGLSAPLLPSSSSRSSFTNPLVRLSMASALNESKESFQCRGEDEESWSAGSIAPVRPTAAPPMTRSASANPVSTSSSSGQSTTSTAIMPGSPLGWRRRPWALSLQLQSPATTTAAPLITVRQAPHSANPYVKSFATAAATYDRRNGSWDSGADVVNPRSRFSLSSSNVDLGVDGDEDDELGGRASASNTTSPAFTWSSSALSFDTSLGSPESRHSNRFVNHATDAAQATPQRGRSNTIAAIPINKPSSVEAAEAAASSGLENVYGQKCLTAAASATTSFEDRRPSSIANEIRGYCPASPPSHVRLRLTFPPTAVAKHAGGVPQEQTIQMAMTASTLDFKEAICLSLRSRHRLSISPSQLALFVLDDGGAASTAAAATAPSTLGSSPQSPHSFTRPSFSPSTGDAQPAGSLRSRSRLRRALSVNQQPQPPSSASPATVITAAASTNRLTPPAAYRQLHNDAGLYEQGLQDDDKIIVRF